MKKDIIPTAPQYIKDFEGLGFGMFVHFGLYSQLEQGEWTFHYHNRSMDEYEKLISTFNVKSMEEIVSTAKSAGCKYICLTTRHHEGFSLYDTKGLSEFDAPHSPAGRDLIAEFVTECRKQDIVPFFYHTTLDWYQEIFEKDFDAYLDYLYKSVEILCSNYGKIGGMWFDGNWSKPDADWQEDRLYKMIHRLQPEAMVINNTGLYERGKLGTDEIDAVTFERGMPAPLDLRGRSKYVSGEMCETLCDHWGVADDINFKPVKQLIEELCECRKVGANFLLNIGPNADGSVSNMQKATMECIGKWMSVYGDAIYNGRPFIAYTDSRDFIQKDATDEKILYLFRFNPGHSTTGVDVSEEFKEAEATLLKNMSVKVKTITWMDSGEDLPFTQDGTDVRVKLTGYPYGRSHCVRVARIITE